MLPDAYDVSRFTDQSSAAVVEVLHQVFDEGGAADNGFKNPTFERAAGKVRRVRFSGDYTSEV
jgi:hypothetical protein